jgi:hypothetical protein
VDTGREIEESRAWKQTDLYVNGDLEQGLKNLWRNVGLVTKQHYNNWLWMGLDPYFISYAKCISDELNIKYGKADLYNFQARR